MLSTIAERIADIIGKKLGIDLRSNLLDFDLDYLPSMPPVERAGLAKRVQDAGRKLNGFLQTHLEEFDKLPAVWVPKDVLP